jgi:hypothetical protein
MGLDIRTPIGVMFSLLGALLAVYGAVGPKDIYAKSLDININLWWGQIMLIFGLVMLWLAKRASAK